MITRLCLLALLVTSLAVCYQHKIDYSRCTGDAQWACFVRETCTTPSGSAKTLVQYRQATVVDCDVVMQIKMLTTSKFHVIMQVLKKGSEKLKPSEGVKLRQGVYQFVCKSGDAVTGNNQYKFVTLGAQVYNDQLIFCSFSAEYLEKSQPFTNLYFAKTDKPELSYTKGDGNPDSVIYGTPKATFWNLISVTETCDYDLLSTSHKISDNYFLSELEDMTSNELSCPISPLVVEFSNKKEEPKEIFCKRPSNKWHYKLGGPEQEITDKVVIYCKERLCRKCVSPPACPGCSNATVSHLSTTDLEACPSLKCTEGIFTGDGSGKLDGTPECVASTTNPMGFGWSLGGKELSMAGCRHKFSCTTPARLPCNDDKCDNSKLEGKDTDTLKCQTEYQLWYVTANDTKEHNTTQLTCDTERGLFKPAEKETGIEIKHIYCISTKSKTDASVAAAGGMNLGLVFGGIAAFVIIAGAAGAVYYFLVYRKRKAMHAAKAVKTKTSSGQSTAGDGEEKKSKKSKRSKKSRSSQREKIKLKEYITWDEKMFDKKIMPYFASAKPSSKLRWLRDYMTRFNSYNPTFSNAESGTSESGTIMQYWNIVRQCIETKCVDSAVWAELFRVALLINLNCPDKSPTVDGLHTLVLAPFEAYMVAFLGEYGPFKKKKEAREISAMRLVAMEILLHCDNKELIGLLHKQEYTEDTEVPLRMIISNCFSYDKAPKYAGIVEEEYRRFLDLNNNLPDPHITEGWGAYHQHCIYGIAAKRICTPAKPEQIDFFEALYEAEQPPRPPDDKRFFSPIDWLFAYKGAFLHRDTQRMASQMYRKYNLNSFVHIEILLRQKCEDKDERERMRVCYQKAMKEFTLMFADLLVGEDDFKEFKAHLEPVMVFLGDVAKEDERISEELVRDKAINMGNMLRDKEFVKDCFDALTAMASPPRQGQ